MKNIQQIFTKFTKQVMSGKFSLLLVILSYIFFTCLYMGPSVWRCTDTLYGFGDNTAGPVWRMGLKPHQTPLGSYENMTNFPLGENLYNPTNYSLSGQSVVIWGLSRTMGPVCGYNVFNMAGFVLSALVMFGFIYALTRNKWLAWLAGYAASFSPYYQMKVGGNPGYGYQALLIGAAWATFNLFKKRRLRDAVSLALLCATCFYFDPYFSLLVASVVGPLIVAGLVVTGMRLRKKNETLDAVKKVMNQLIKSFAIFMVLIGPLIFVTVKNSRTITSSVAAMRGNVLFEARACSNLPHEYVTPFVLHPIFERLVGKTEYISTIDALNNRFPCGIGESTVGISIAIVTTTLIGLVIMGWERLNRRKLGLRLGYDAQLVVYGMLAVLVWGVALGLPPAKLFGIVPTPSSILLEITTTWRTLTRVFVTVNFAFITLFTIVLGYFWKTQQRYRRIMLVLFGLLIFAVFVEYQAFKPFRGNSLSTFSYKQNAPTSYTWLKEQSGINSIAEYPLEKAGGESNAMAYYLSMQVIHQKKLFNGNIPSSSSENYKSSLKDISDPQTVQVLRGIGVDAVVIHGVEESIIRKIPGLEIVHVGPQEKFSILGFTPLVTKDTVVIAKITKNNIQSTEMMQLDKGFVRNTNIIKSAADWNYEATNNSQFKIVSAPGKYQGAMISSTRCFEVKIAGENDTANITVWADGKKKQSIPADAQNFSTVKINANDSIRIANDKGFNMQVRNLGCER